MVVEADNLTKRYKQLKKSKGIVQNIQRLFKGEYEVKTAVDKVSVSIEQGETVGIVGTAGAGKTTFIKMLCGLTEPSSGEVKFLDEQSNVCKVHNDKDYSIIMGKNSRLKFDGTTVDTLIKYQEKYHLSEEQFKENKEFLGELFGVTELLRKPVSSLTLKERMEMELVVALMCKPKVLFLDEPLHGLEEDDQKDILTMLSKVNEALNTTIILASNTIKDMKVLCQRFIVFHGGRIMFDGMVKELFEKYMENEKITFTFSKPTDIVFRDDKLDVIESSMFKKVIIVPRERVEGVINNMRNLEPTEIIVEEEELENMIGRICSGKESGLAVKKLRSRNERI